MKQNSNINNHERYRIIRGLGESYFSVESATVEDDRKFIQDNGVNNIILNDQNKFLDEDLLALEGLPIKKLIINPKSNGKFSYAGLKLFGELEYLKINNTKASLIDLSENTSLKKIYIENCSKLKGVNKLKSLESLIMTKPNPDLLSPTLFNNLKKLNHISIAGANLSDGFGFLSLANISSLFLYGMKFVNFKGIGSLDLKTLHVEKCNAADNCDVIYSSNTISELKIIDSFNVPSAKMLLQMRMLKTLVVMGKSMIQHGDLSPLMMKLEHFSFDNKRHYSVKYEEFKEKYLLT
jgi:hypothetical protein